MGRVATLLIAATVVATSCDRRAREGRESTRIEAVIEAAIGARVQVPVRVRCAWLAPQCRVMLPDSRALPVRLHVERGEVVWSLDGALVLAADLEAYLRDAVADLGAPQVARCGVRIRTVAPGERIECQLQYGGKAFVIPNADGTTTVEIVLDPTAGDARAEVVTIEREASLEGMSRALDEGDAVDGE